MSQLNDLAAIETAWNRNTAPLATITNLTPAGFSSELVHQMLVNASTRQNLIDNIFTLVLNRGYGGVNIDFERVLGEDRDRFSTFLNDLKNRLRKEGLLMTIAVPPKTREDISWLQGYDYGAIGSVVDFMMIMAYDWHHRGSKPRPIAPINQVAKQLNMPLRRLALKKSY